MIDYRAIILIIIPTEKKYMYFLKTTYMLGLQLYNKCILI